jgi:hypothetical protein
VLGCALLAGMASSHASITWDGPAMTFTKPSGANWNDQAYQDRLTDNVWLTRANTRGLFNINVESSYTSFFSPAGTAWADGTTANLTNLTFFTWEAWNGHNPPSMLNRDAVLHLITDDIYLNIKFTVWDERTGGGFAYERATAIPEPSAAVLTLLGLGSLLLLNHRRRWWTKIPRHWRAGSASAGVTDIHSRQDHGVGGSRLKRVSLNPCREIKQRFLLSPAATPQRTRRLD